MANRILSLERKVNSIVLIEAEKISMTYPKRYRVKTSTDGIDVDEGDYRAKGFID